MLRTTLIVLLLAGTAEARFGKAGSKGNASSSSSSSSSSSYHSASSVQQPQPSYSDNTATTTRYASAPPRHHRHHFGYSFWYAPAPVVVGAPYVPMQEQQEALAPIRVMVGVEGQGYLHGATLGVLAAFEGDRWGVSLSGADIIVAADDGSGGVDHIGDFTAHLTFAFLTGEYGRLRVETGADALFAPSAIFVGPTFGLSGVVWFGGPLGIEGSAMVTPWPFIQLDGRLGLALAIDNWGIRAGWRVQLLNDRGVVDGVVHQDIFNGPYLGLSYVF